MQRAAPGAQPEKKKTKCALPSKKAPPPKSGPAGKRSIARPRQASKEQKDSGIRAGGRRAARTHLLHWAPPGGGSGTGAPNPGCNTSDIFQIATINHSWGGGANSGGGAPPILFTGRPFLRRGTKCAESWPTDKKDIDDFGFPNQLSECRQSAGVHGL